MKKVLSTLEVDREKMRKNLTLSKNMALAEAAYILLSMTGEGNAHERIRKITLNCEKKGISLDEALREEPALWEALQRRLKELLNLSADLFFSDPFLYSGLAVKKTRIIVEKYKEYLKLLKEKYPCF